jgi:hypothetical protein
MFSSMAIPCLMLNLGANLSQGARRACLRLEMWLWYGVKREIASARSVAASSYGAWGFQALNENMTWTLPSYPELY